jgi:hypothetical protein
MNAETPPAPGNPTPPSFPTPRNLPPGLSAPTVGDSCGAARLQHLVGGPTPVAFDVTGPVRIFAQGDAVTMDFNAQRLNVLLDSATRTRILAITCG